LLDGRDLGAERDVLNSRGERFLQLIGAADDLEHRRLHRELGREIASEPGLEQLVERDRRRGNARRRARARHRRITAPRRPRVFDLRRKSSFLPQPLDDALAIVLGQWSIQCVRGHRLRQQL
jgi:hypothetical protein